MIQTNNVSIRFGGRVLFQDVNLKFTKGNCYGIIGANGAGKSTFLRVLSGDLEPNTGEVIIDKGERLSVLNQNQNAFDNETVINTVLMGHKRLMEIMKEKDALYAKPDFSEEDGINASNLEAEFMDLNGWEAESDAGTLLNGLGIETELHSKFMKELDAKQKVKVLLAQSLFGNPDILILDEPTNNLDIKSVRWLEEFLMDFQNTVIIVSHNRHFLNKVCTHICDVDYGKIQIFVGNYDFWYESSQLLLRQAKDQNKKMEARVKELQEFIARFSANASKSKQATSRKRELDKIQLEDIKPSSRKYPFIDFKPERDAGNDILTVENLTKKGYFEDITFTIKHDQKVAVLCDNSLSTSKLYDVLFGLDTADSGRIVWGKTITTSYLPQNNDSFFAGCDLTLVDWLRQFSKDKTESFVRGWLGRMLFSGEESMKKANVLSGGEKVRCMLARMMLTSGNFLLLDEPTNHLDLESITALNTGMQNFSGNMLFSTHDHEINATVANRIIVIEHGKKVFDKECTYEEYLDTIK